MKCPKTGKVGHRTREGAVIARKKMDRALQAYKCGHCGRWHLGNTTATRLTNMNRLFDRMHARERAQESAT